ncbi:uncharacterized protein BDV17DRAFT_298935 [Aspergillus undulatus]|uniref:uncharacterized protein n=1 Tax=Aspergillus undulatus TaxID=1810928 RepID=UPI003CCD7852
MATKHPNNPKDQAQAILAIATRLQSQLALNDNPNSPALDQGTRESLEKTIRRLPLPTDSIPTSTRRQLDNEGTKLWNLPVLRMRDTGENHDVVLLCKVKALAYAMLDAAAPMTGPGNYRSLGLAFRVIRVCIEQGILDLSQKMMESAATRLDLMKSSKDDIDAVKSSIFTTEYYMLRIYLAWSQDRLDIADHLFSKLPETDTTEQKIIVMDICYMIGNTALAGGQYEAARTWLSRALDVCEISSNDQAHKETQYLKNKRLSVLHAYARSHLHATTTAPESELAKTVHLMKTEYGNSFPVLAFSLDVLSKDALNEEYFETLKSSIKELGHGDTNLKMVYHYITKLRSLSLERFVEACGQLLNKLAALDTSTREQWMEKILVSVIWSLTSTNANGGRCLQLAETTAQVLKDCGLNKPSEDANQASLILIWKHIDTMLSSGSIGIAEQWCHFLLRQPLFQKTPDTEAKSFRKLILCVMEKYNPSTARQVFDEIPEDCKTCPLTLYLLYRLALLAEDISFASTYIQSLCKQGADAEFVWSCIADALQLGKTNMVSKSIESIMAVVDAGSFEHLQIPQLLQYVLCTIREENTASHEDLLGQVTSLLDCALAAAAGRSRSFSSDQLCWFVCKSYRIALDLYKTASTQATVKLLNISIKLMELDQGRVGAEPNTISVEHYLKCTFLQSMTIISEARRQKKSSRKEQYYKEARGPIKQFQGHIQHLGNETAMNADSQTWLDKHRIILSFEFEAAVFLRQWDDLVTIIESSKPIVGPKLSSVFLDCLLRSGAPSSCLSKFVKQMIRTFHSSTSPCPFLRPVTESETEAFTTYLPRHLRCLFSLSLQAQEYILAESVLDQALFLARPSNNPKVNSYPQDELHWLATSAFNRAVEFFLLSADGECARWAGKAIALADCIGDNGEAGLGSGLGALLRTNFAKLKLQS